MSGVSWSLKKTRYFKCTGSGQEREKWEFPFPFKMASESFGNEWSLWNHLEEIISMGESAVAFLVSMSSCFCFCFSFFCTLFCSLLRCMSRSGLGTSARQLKITTERVRAGGAASPWCQPVMPGILASLVVLMVQGGCGGSSHCPCIPAGEGKLGEGVKGVKPLVLKLFPRSCTSIDVLGPELGHMVLSHCQDGRLPSRKVIVLLSKRRTAAKGRIWQFCHKVTPVWEPALSWHSLWLLAHLRASVYLPVWPCAI